MVVANPYVWGTGRRKTSVARVRIKSGTGQFLVNGHPMERFFTTPDTQRSVMRPLLGSWISTSIRKWLWNGAISTFAQGHLCG